MPLCNFDKTFNRDTDRNSKANTSFNEKVTSTQLFRRARFKVFL